MNDKLQTRISKYAYPYNREDRVPVDRDRLGAMVNGYIECALWSTQDDSFFGDGGSFLDEGHDRDSIAEPTLLQMIRDCVAFWWRNRKVLQPLYDSGEYNESQCGHDFWLSRNGHGAGFFDRGNSWAWVALQDDAQGFGTVDLWVDEDGTVAQNTYGISN